MSVFNFTPPEARVENSTSSRSRISWLDSLKGFAIICVVLGHVVDGYIKAGVCPESQAFMCQIWQAIYAFHMPLFFVISGFFFSLAYFDKDGNVKGRKLGIQLVDLGVVYVLFSFLLVAFKVICAQFVNTSASFSDLLDIWHQPIAPYWYIYVLAILYVVCIPMAKFKSFACFVALGAALALSAGSHWISFTSEFSLERLLFHLLFFAIGLFIHRVSWRVSWPVALVGLALAALLFVFCAKPGLSAFSNAISKTPIVNTLVALGLCLFFWKAFASFRFLDNRLFALCGRYCLEIYLIHCFFTAGFRSLFGLVGLANFWLSLIINTVLSTALPLAFAILMQRVGLYSYIFRPAHTLMGKGR